MSDRIRGTGNRYAKDFGGNYLQREIDKAKECSIALHYNKRFCETCQSAKPKGNRPAKKGWLCNECLAKINKKESIK